MTLDNLRKLGRLKPHTATRDKIGALPAARLPVLNVLRNKRKLSDYTGKTIERYAQRPIAAHPATLYPDPPCASRPKPASAS